MEIFVWWLVGRQHRHRHKVAKNSGRRGMFVSHTYTREITDVASFLFSGWWFGGEEGPPWDRTMNENNNIGTNTQRLKISGWRGIGNKAGLHMHNILEEQRAFGCASVTAASGYNNPVTRLNRKSNFLRSYSEEIFNLMV